MIQVNSYFSCFSNVSDLKGQIAADAEELLECEVCVFVYMYFFLVFQL